MDSTLFLLWKDKEYVFKKGTYYAEHGKDGYKAYDHAFALVSPAALGPMSLFLTTQKKETILEAIAVDDD